MRFRFLPALLLLSLPMLGQQIDFGIFQVGSDPTGLACNPGAPLRIFSGVIYTCISNAYGATSSAVPVPLLVAGIVDGVAPVTITTGTTATLGGTYRSGYTFNQEATAGTAVTYTLPVASAGRQYCVANSNNGSAADTGALTLQTSGGGQFIIFTDGTLSASGGHVSSGGAARDAACAVGVDATHWTLYTNSGTWSKF